MKVDTAIGNKNTWTNVGVWIRKKIKLKKVVCLPVKWRRKYSFIYG